MKAVFSVVAAGATFASGAVVGLITGVLAANRMERPWLVPVGLLVGAAIGGYSAIRVLVRAME